MTKYYALLKPLDLSKKGAVEAKNLRKFFDPDDCLYFFNKADAIAMAQDAVNKKDTQQFPLYEIESEDTKGRDEFLVTLSDGVTQLPAFGLDYRKVKNFKLSSASFEHIDAKAVGIKLPDQKLSLDPSKKPTVESEETVTVESSSNDSDPSTDYKKEKEKNVKSDSESSSNDSDPSSDYKKKKKKKEEEKNVKSDSESSSNESDPSSDHKKKKESKNQNGYLNGYFTTTTATILGVTVVSTAFFALGGVPLAAAVLAKAGLVLPATVGSVQFGISLGAGLLAATCTYAANALYQYFSGTEKMRYTTQIDSKKDEIKGVFEVIKDKKFQRKLEDTLDIKHGVKPKFDRDGARANAKKQPKGNELSQLLDYEAKVIAPLAGLRGKELKKAEKEVLHEAEKAVAKKKFAA